jgi:hypothetical protein
MNNWIFSNEITYEIFFYVYPYKLYKFRLTCKEFRDIIDSLFKNVNYCIKHKIVRKDDVISSFQEMKMYISLLYGLNPNIKIIQHNDVDYHSPKYFSNMELMCDKLIISSSQHKCFWKNFVLCDDLDHFFNGSWIYKLYFRMYDNHDKFIYMIRINFDNKEEIYHIGGLPTVIEHWREFQNHICCVYESFIYIIDKLNLKPGAFVYAKEYKLIESQSLDIIYGIRDYIIFDNYIYFITISGIYKLFMKNQDRKELPESERQKSVLHLKLDEGYHFIRLFNNYYLLNDSEISISDLNGIEKFSFEKNIKSIFEKRRWNQVFITRDYFIIFNSDLSLCIDKINFNLNSFIKIEFNLRSTEIRINYFQTIPIIYDHSYIYLLGFNDNNFYKRKFPNSSFNSEFHTTKNRILILSKNKMQIITYGTKLI